MLDVQPEIAQRENTVWGTQKEVFLYSRRKLPPQEGCLWPILSVQIGKSCPSKRTATLWAHSLASSWGKRHTPGQDTMPTTRPGASDSASGALRLSPQPGAGVPESTSFIHSTNYSATARCQAFLLDPRNTAVKKPQKLL